MGLECGVGVKVVVEKVVNRRFEPSGITPNANIRFVSSVLDYIARWLGGRFISPDYLKLNGEQAAHAHAPQHVVSPVMGREAYWTPEPMKLTNAHEGAPAGSECGMLMVPNGACYKCENCGSTSCCS